jgi:drug/metabolite transporter (DMT)-like permease
LRENSVPLSANWLGILFGLTSAGIWGSGDFSGGRAARRSHPFQVLALSALAGITILLGCGLLWHETLPSLSGIGWAMLAGAAGTLGLASLYRALSMGHAATVAPTSAVISALLPVGFGILTAGVPSAARLAGFALALLGIWLVSRPAQPDHAVSPQGFLLACLAGVGFGTFLILIVQIEPGHVFLPLVVARCMQLGIVLILLRASRRPLPALASNPIALLAGILDAGGNVFYMLSQHYTRLDVAAVLSSLYPAPTVLLAWIILKEKVSRPQWAGVVVCLAAIVLITI